MEVDITNAKCEICGKQVEPFIHFGQRWESKDDKMVLNNQLSEGWSCNGHGAVGAFINGIYSHKPSKLFDKILLPK